VTPLLRLRGASRAFGDVQAVEGVDLDVSRGRLLALLGPSGCGKTTLLRLIAGFERPDRGTVELDGKVVAGPGVWVPPETRRVGMVFQDYALFPHLSVAANIGFGLLRRPGRRRRDDRARVARVLELVDLTGLEARFPHQLSGGQQQRVALARALAPEPSVVLLDEPFSNLDAALRTQVRADVARILQDAGATAILVTHDQEEALAIADEVAVLRNGRIAQQAAPEVVYHAPADRSVAAFVGEAEFLPGTSRGVRVDTELGDLALTAPQRGPVEVMVRPEDVLLQRDPTGAVLVVGREFYGHDQMLFLRLGSGRVVRARLGPVTDLAPGDRCSVAVTTAVHAFPLEPAGAGDPGIRAR